MPTGAQESYVLTSDDQGRATWQQMIPESQTGTATILLPGANPSTCPIVKSGDTVRFSTAYSGAGTTASETVDIAQVPSGFYPVITSPRKVGVVLATILLNDNVTQINRAYPVYIGPAPGVLYINIDPNDISGGYERVIRVLVESTWVI